MELAKVTSKGQITIPVAIRRKLGLKTGSQILFVEEDGRIVMMNPTIHAVLQAQKAFAGVAESLGIKTEQDVVDLVKEVRREMAAERATENVAAPERTAQAF